MKKFNLIGLDTQDSLSPHIHNFVFNQMGIKATYSSINIDSSANIEKITAPMEEPIIIFLRSYLSESDPIGH